MSFSKKEILNEIDRLKIEIGILSHKESSLKNELTQIRESREQFKLSLPSLEDKVTVYSKIISIGADKVGLFSKTHSNNLNLIFPEKQYSCSFEFGKDSEGYYKDIKYKVYSKDKLIDDLEDQEGASFLNINSSLSLMEIVASGEVGPKILFLDEPFANLDKENWAKIEPLIQDFCEDNDLQLFIISHHIPQSENVITI